MRRYNHDRGNEDHQEECSARIRTIFFKRSWMINDVMIVQIQMYRKVCKRKLKDIPIRHEVEKVPARSARPVFGEVCKECDVVSDEEDTGSIERHVKCPLSLSVPGERRRHVSEDLKEEAQEGEREKEGRNDMRTRKP